MRGRNTAEVKIERIKHEKFRKKRKSARKRTN